MKKVLFVILAIALCTTSVFAVDEPVYRSLPSDYIQVEYLESTGTQYVDTGFKPNNNTRLRMDVDINSTASHAVFSARNANYTGMYGFTVLGTSSVRSDYT